METRLLVILGKALGNFLVEKLRVLILLEADFNTLHKINFNSTLLPSLEASSTISQEILGGRRLQTAAHVVLNKN